jgi:hypothetical protein
MRELDKISADLFDKIRSRFENVSVGDDKAKATNDPSQARFFNFDYVDKNGKNYGNITISLIDNGSLKIYFGKNIVTDLEEEEQAEWFEFLRSMRHFAKRNLLTFDTRDITRSNLKVRDLQQISKHDGVYKTSEINVAESKLFGTTRSSYQSLGPVRLIVRHSNNVDETVHGSRARNIDAIFVETHLGERFLLPFKKLTPARAMARHVSEGGSINDEIGTYITQMVTEMSDLSIFVRKMRNRTFEDAETITMVEASIERYQQLHNQLGVLSGTKGYRSFKENFVPDNTIMEDDVDYESMKERFVQKIFDDRLNEALPYVYRAYKTKKLAMENNYIAEIESWANRLLEGTWAVPNEDQDKEKLRELMEKPIEAGPNGDNASALLYDLIGSDSLYDEFHEASKSDTGPQTDVRPLIVEWLKEHGYEEMATEFDQQLQQQGAVDTTQPQPGQLTPQANQPGIQSSAVAQQPIPAAPPPTTQESVDTIRRLAGLTTLRKL